MPETAQPACLPPGPPANPRRLRLPQGACDTHFHVFAPDAPLSPRRTYTPCPASIEEWSALAEAFGIARGVLVQPSVYGTDNSLLLRTLEAHAQRLRGIVVVPGDTPRAELMGLDALGVRGIRINLRNQAGIGLEAVAELAPHIRDLGWHLQFLLGPGDIAAVIEAATRHGVVAVIDHLALMEPDPDGAALAALQRALDGGNVWVKVSGAYRLRDSADHEGYRLVVGRLGSTHPKRLLWGSDWPHPDLFETMPADADLVALALDALPRPVHEDVFVHNPLALYWAH